MPCYDILPSLISLSKKASAAHYSTYTLLHLLLFRHLRRKGEGGKEEKGIGYGERIIGR